MLKKKSIILLSSGLDSTVNFLVALRKTDVVLALTFDYGQRAATREIEHSKAICARYGVSHKVVELPWLREITKTSLVNVNQEVPTDVAINDLKRSQETAKAVWVPNRNGVFLNIAASFAESLGAQIIVPGFNKEEAATFPDNSTEYLEAANVGLSFSTANQVVVECYTTQMLKPEIAQLGRELGLDFNLVWSCYFGGSNLCGECESCERFKNATSKPTAVSCLSNVGETSQYFS